MWAPGAAWTLIAAGEAAGPQKDIAMTKIRLTQLGCLMLLIAWYVSSALPASATPDPPPGYYASPAAPLPAGPPAQPPVIHDHIALGSYVLIVGLTVVGTLILVAMTARLRRPSVRHVEQPTGA
jgi:hypothetical protein